MERVAEEGNAMKETRDDSEDSEDSTSTMRHPGRVPAPIPSQSSRLDPASPNRVDSNRPCRRTLAGAFEATGNNGDDSGTDDIVGHRQPEKAGRAAGDAVNNRPSIARYTSFFVRDILADSETHRKDDSCQPGGAGSLPAEAREEPGHRGNEREEESIDDTRSGQ